MGQGVLRVNFTTILICVIVTGGINHRGVVIFTVQQESKHLVFAFGCKAYVLLLMFKLLIKIGFVKFS